MAMRAVSKTVNLGSNPGSPAPTLPRASGVCDALATTASHAGGAVAHEPGSSGDKSGRRESNPP